MTDKTVEVGNFYSEKQIYKVEEVQGTEAVVTNTKGDKIAVSLEYLNNLSGPNDFKETRHVTQTQIEQILSNSKGELIKVNFNKKPQGKNIAADVMSALRDAKIHSKPWSEIEKVVKRSVSTEVKGDERTLVGYPTKNGSDNGRVLVIDLEVEENNKFRMVDTRTVNWLIVDGVKYTRSDVSN